MNGNIPDQTRADVTRLLVLWTGGNQQAMEDLLPLVYDELRKLARRYLQRERPGHTLQSTALVHEAYLRMIDQHDVSWQGRAHFFGIAAQMMRESSSITPADATPQNVEQVPASSLSMKTSWPLPSAISISSPSTRPSTPSPNSIPNKDASWNCVSSQACRSRKPPSPQNFSRDRKA